MAGKRMLHERICRSEKLARVSAEAERCWTRLLVLADDNGNIEHDVDVIRGHGFPKLRGVTNEQIEGWLRELIEVRGDVNGKYGQFGLLAEYEDSGKKFLHVIGFEAFQMLRSDRAGKVEFPPHPDSLGPVRFSNQRLPDDGQMATSGCQAGDTWQPLVATPQPLTGGSKDKVREEKKGKAGANPALRPASEFAFKGWETKFGRRPNWQQKDWAGIAALFKRLPDLSVPLFQRHWRNYLASTEQFIQKQGWGLAYFCAHFDSFAVAVHGKGEPPKRSVSDHLQELDARRKGRN